MARKVYYLIQRLGKGPDPFKALSKKDYSALQDLEPGKITKDYETYLEDALESHHKRDALTLQERKEIVSITLGDNDEENDSILRFIESSVDFIQWLT